MELAAYQLRNYSRTCFYLWKKVRDKGTPILTWEKFEMAFLGHFFPQELREAKVQDFLTLK